MEEQFRGKQVQKGYAALPSFSSCSKFSQITYDHGAVMDLTIWIATRIVAEICGSSYPQIFRTANLGERDAKRNDAFRRLANPIIIGILSVYYHSGTCYRLLLRMNVPLETLPRPTPPSALIQQL
uniref:Bm12963 n=1 Tax=Brugia malayi TaxID=6279 RepID=A0A1I9G643_BRUMA|nr:Bm12963 [Brugia malayi]